MTNAPPLLWDIFCQVVDNHGDLGVCWRLARDLAARGQRVRLWVDEPAALAWLAPGTLHAAPDARTLAIGAAPGITVLRWANPLPADALAALPRADVWIEAFGCTLAPEFIAQQWDTAPTRGPNHSSHPVWINLEYLSAEPWVERMHALPSPVQHGPAAGATKWFFYPGFTPQTGGLLREADLPSLQAAFDARAWLSRHALPTDEATRVSLFCYEPPALGGLLDQLAGSDQPTRLLVTAGRAQAAVQHALDDKNSPGSARRPDSALHISYLPHLPQPAFDELLWTCDWNLVRGEDSLVGALWAGQPLVWQLYPQHDDAHHAKLQAFLNWLDAPPSLRRFHAVWNGVEPAAALPAPDLPAWRACVQAARARLLAQPDLCRQLIGFVAQRR